VPAVPEIHPQDRPLLEVSGPLRVERVEGADPLGAIADEWRALFDSSACRLPFLAFEWAQAWWTQMRRDRWTVRDVLELRAVRDGSGKLVAVAPLMVSERPGAGPVRVRQLHFIGPDGNLTEVRGILCVPGMEQDVHAALRVHLEAYPRWDWMLWSGVPPELSDIGIQQRWLTRMEAREEHVLDLPGSWDEFKAGLKRNVRESLRKCYNSLKRDSHAFTLRVAKTQDEVLAALPRLFELHAARAAVTDTVRHRDVFEGERERRFMEAMYRAFAQRGQARAYSLEIAGQVVAVRLGFQFGRAIYLYYSGYDPKWSDYSVMTTCLAEALKHAINEGVTTASLSTGTDQSKSRWGGRVIARQEWVQHHGTPHALVAYGTVRRVRRFLRRFGLFR